MQVKADTDELPGIKVAVEYTMHRIGVFDEVQQQQQYLSGAIGDHTEDIKHALKYDTDKLGQQVTQVQQQATVHLQQQSQAITQLQAQVQQVYF